MGFHVIHFISVTSTQEIARGIMKENVVIVADEQRYSYGRRGRTWYSPPGGLWMSLIIRSNLWEILTLAASVAVVMALEKFGIQSGIKWPNDIIYNEKKLGGIIAEKKGELVILGIGINLKNEIPPEIEDVAINLPQIDRDALLPVLLECLENLLSLSKDELLNEWRKRNITLGRRVCIENGEKVCGVAKDIDEHGGIILEIEGERRHFYTGDLRFMD